MPVRVINGVHIGFDAYGSGEPVLLLTGTGAPGRVWRVNQAPALVSAGFRAITMDNRGVPPSDTCDEGFTLDDMVSDTEGLIEFLGIGPCRIVGFSLGAIIVQELLMRRADLVKQAVLMATRGRTDPLSAVMASGELELCDTGVKLPARYEAYVRAIQGLSRRTLNDDELTRDWLEAFEMSPVYQSVSRSQLAADSIPNRLEAYRGISVPCLVIGFEDDMIISPRLCREVAASIPGARYQEIPGCGHYGYLEQPAAVNDAIISFFRAQSPAQAHAITPPG